VNMLRKLRLTLGMLCLVFVTLLFVDFTGVLHAWLGWMAKIQFLPALLALNAGVIVCLILLTLIAGRVYCSVICPLGVFQDVVARLGRGRKKMPLHVFQTEKLAALRCAGSVCAGDAVGCACPGSLA